MTNLPGGQRGARTDVHKDGVTQNLSKADEPIQTNLPIGVPTASVGVSVSAGMNTEFSREKIEVSAWCTLPCLTDPKSVERTYQICYDYALAQVTTRLDTAGRELFPHLYAEEIADDTAK